MKKRLLIFVLALVSTSATTCWAQQPSYQALVSPQNDSARSAVNRIDDTTRRLIEGQGSGLGSGDNNGSPNGN